MLLNPGRNWIPIIGTGVIYRETGMRLHPVPDHILGKRLRPDLELACEGDAWWACVAFSNGRLALIPSRPGLAPLPEDWREKMIEVATLANRDLHHGGHWVMAISDGVLSALWRDWDGDLHLENTFNETWARLKQKPREEWVDTLNACWQEATARLSGLRDPNAQIFRALGEASKGRPAR